MAIASRVASGASRNSPTRRTLLASNFAFQSLENIPTPFDDATVEHNYATLQTAAADIAATANLSVVIETVTTLPSGRQIKAMRINDDGTRPVVLISLGIHGNELNLAKGVMTAAKEFAGTTANNVLDKARQSIALVVILGVNPDGMVADTRQNGNGINLNRNWPWFWQEAQDADKGSSPSDQPETSGIQAWGLTFARRIIVTLDTHAWWSRTTWGFLVEELYHSPESERTHRLGYNYCQQLVSQRNWSSFTIINEIPFLTEYRSYRKPYLNTWFRQHSRPDAFSLVVEVPETENQGVSATVGLDLFTGIMAAAVDATTARNLMGVAVTPALSVINSNSDFSAWNDAENRPNFFNYTRANLTGRDSRRRFRMSRTTNNAFPKALEKAAYCTYGDIGFVAGGADDAGATATCYRDNVDGTITSAPALPVAIQSGAVATDGTSVWFYGGFTAASAYSDKLYVKTWAGADAWVEVASVTVSGSPIALQRHTMHYYGGYLYVVGGRTSSAVSKDIYKVDPATGVATLFAQLSGLTQRHTSWLRSDGFIYIFGGDGGATVKSTIEKLDLTSATRTTLAATLPAARNRQILAATGTTSSASVYIAFGTNVTSPAAEDDWKSNIYVFSASDETVSSYSYDLDGDIDDHGDLITIAGPAYADGIARYRTADQVMTFMTGANLAGRTAEVWELQDGSTTLGLRSAATSHGYIRSTQAFDTADGDRYVIVTRVGTDTAPDENRMVQCTPVAILGQTGGTRRYIVPLRRVPPRHATPMTLPVYIRAGEGATAALRAYFRVWTPGKTLKFFDGFQVLKVTDGKAAAAFDLIRGTSQAAVVRTCSMSLTSGSAGSPVAGVFSPYWTSRSQVDQQVIGFTVSGGLSSLELWYTASDTTDTEPNGTFELRWNDGADQSHTFDVFMLNHTRTETEWRKDMVNWRITPTETGLTFDLWFYGKLMTATVTCSATTISGYTMTGSGVLDHGPHL
jgi:hypothetical protein